MTTITGPTPTPASTLAAGTTTAGPAAAPPSAGTTLGSDYNTFLKLLTTQLQNQDPESPLDTNQMTQQLVSFSQVEQAVNSNTKLDQLVALQSTNQTVASLPLVGHTVQIADSKGPLVNGKASFGYNLPTQATATTLTVTDANGNTVYQGPGSTTTGDNSFAWNGQASDGSTAPDGIYNLDVAATGADGSPIKAAISSYGTIDSIKINNGVASLTMGQGMLSEPLSSILSVTL
jgi:flagellar basal-body rod modification protein FlgD